MSCKMLLNLSLKTSITPVLPIKSATVACVPSKSVRFLVTPFNESVIGNVAVVPVGIALEILTVK